MCKAGMANADPIIVWGRVNLHNTKGKGGFDTSSSVLVDITVEEAFNCSFNECGNVLLLSKLRVVENGLVTGEGDRSGMMFVV